MNGLYRLATRLTPNPCLTVGGTLQVILDGIDRIDDADLARALAYVGARAASLDAKPVTDELWNGADPATRDKLIGTAQAIKAALREIAE